MFMRIRPAPFTSRRWGCFAVRVQLLLLLSSILPDRAEGAGSPERLSKINEIIDAPRYRHAQWGLLVTDLKSGDVLVERNADKLFAPASTTKLYSVATALDALGPEHVFETPIYLRGETNQAGVLKGDLILVATGDLTLGGRTGSPGEIAFKDGDHTYANGNENAALTAPDPLAGLNELARQVADAGIKRIEGEVWIDDRLFEHAASSGSGPTRVSPIVINDNLIDLVITPGVAGAAARVTWRPESAVLQVDAWVETVSQDQVAAITVRQSEPGKITVRGKIPQNHKPLLRVTEVAEPASFARALLMEALRRAGVTVEASLLTSNRVDLLPSREYYQAVRPIAIFRSPPFREELKLILKVSHNLHASTLPLLVAVRNGKRTLEDGLRLEHDFLKRAGVDVETISFGGGAGGTRSDYTTPRATVQLLRAISSRPDFAAYKSGLPVLGVDGTLHSGVPESSPARGRAFAKTGTLIYDNVMNGGYLLTSKALAGYLTTHQNRELAFAFYVNNVQLSDADETVREGQVLGRLCEILFEGM